MKSDIIKEQDTLKFIIKMYAQYINEMNYNKNDFYLNVSTVKEIAHGYAKDVVRLKACHDIEYIDCHKIAGYLTYWISKLKPITIINPLLYKSKSNSAISIADHRQLIEAIININEHFSLAIGVSRVKSNLVANGFSTQIKISQNFKKHFFYLLKYRITTGDNLSMIFYFIERLKNANKTLEEVTSSAQNKTLS